jgi:L-threonylcarbamoyladenylate synthase
MTEIIKVNPQKPENVIIRKAADIIKKNGLVAFPTETVYGLGANALNSDAVKKIFFAKERPIDNPLIIHIANKDDIYTLAKNIPKETNNLIRKFFPGPLTIVLEKKSIVPNETTAKLSTVAIRMPKNRIAIDLIQASQTPIAAPSANRAGRPSPTRAEHVFQDLKEKVDLILDGGPTKLGLESTVVDLTVETPQILRPGSVTLEMLRPVLKKIELHPSILGNHADLENIPKSPGMKYRHYAPKTKLMVIVGKKENVHFKIEELIHDLHMKKMKVGIASVSMKKYPADHIESLGYSKNEIAKNLFDILRRFDELDLDLIIAEGVDEEGIGLAIMNRLQKASGYAVVRV